MAEWSDKGTQISKIGEKWNVNGGQQYSPADGVKTQDFNNFVESVIFSQETAAEAKTMSQDAKNLAQEANEAVAIGQGTVVKVNNVPVAEFDADSKVDKASKQPKLVSDTFLSRPTATYDVEIVDSTPNVKTAEIKSIKGCSIKAIQKNGNFNGMTDWVLNNATVTTANGIATITVTTNLSAGLFGSANQGRAVAGHKYYLSVWVKAKYANFVRIGFIGKTATALAVANQWVLISGIVTPTYTGDEIYFYHDTITQYAIGDTFEIKDFRVIDLTESDQSLFNMTKEQLDVRLPRLAYFEGIRHTNLKKLISTGDNLVNVADHDEEVVDYYYTDHSYGLVLLPNTEYEISFNYEIVNTTASTLGVGIGYGETTYSYDIRAFVAYPNLTSGKFTATFTTLATFQIANPILWIRELNSVVMHTSTVKISNIMVQFGVNSTTEYKPYTEDYIDLPDIILQSDDELTPDYHIKRRDEAGELLEEPIYTPIEWDNKYSAYNYGMEITDDLAEFDIVYPLDIVKQVETNTEILAEQEKQIAKIANIIYPVGSIYMSVNDTSPASFFGGTWEQMAQGRTLVGVDTTQTEFNTVEKTGGAKTHTLTINQIPSHNHSGTEIRESLTIRPTGAGFFEESSSVGVDRYAVDYTQESTATTSRDYQNGSALQYKKEVKALHGVPANGGGQSHNNLQPYVTCYIWKRTA